MSVAATTIDSPESEFELSHHEVDPYSPPPRTVTSIVNALSGEWLDVGHFRKGLHDERRIYKATETTKRVGYGLAVVTSWFFFKGEIHPLG